MPTLNEWLSGVSDDGVPLPPERVQAYRRLVAVRNGISPSWNECVHRGPILRERKADLCGRRGQMFPVYSCGLHGECVHTRFCEKQPEKICWQCEDATDGPGLRFVDLTVIVPCHNYGRYLEACIDSVLASDRLPLSLVIVDDASTDDTPEICRRRGVRSLRVECRDVHKARAAGLAGVTSKYVLFLDADNTIPPTYLSTAVDRLETDRGLAGVFPVLMGFDGGEGPRNGTGDAPEIVTADDIEPRNFCDAGTVWRSDVLRQSGAFEIEITPGSPAADWRVAREVLRSGPWKIARGTVPLNYRVHASQMSRDPVDYWTAADLRNERVTIISALSGRWHHWPDQRAWVARQAWPEIDWIIVDSSKERPSISELGLDGWRGNLSLIRHDLGERGLADRDRVSQITTRKRVETVVSSIYNRAIAAAQTEFVFFLEDDVFPKRDDAIGQLMRRMGPRVAGVSGAYPHRYAEDHACAFSLPWRSGLFSLEGPECERVGGSGFGCLLARRSVLRRFPLSGDRESSPHYDVDLGERVAPLGWEMWLDRSVMCDHRVERPSV